MLNKIQQIIALCMIGLCCFGSDESAKYALSTKWISYAGGTGFDPDAVYALTTDIHTNAYFGGVLGSGWLENADSVDTMGLLDEWGIAGILGSGFVAKTDNDGVLAWSSTLTYEWGSSIYGITSTNDAVYVGGAINNLAVMYDEEENSLWYPWVDAIVSSLNSADGTLKWKHELSSVSGNNYYNTESAYKAVAVDASGNIYAVGYTSMTNLPSSAPYAGGKDVVIAKYEPTRGDLVWVRYLGGANDEEAHAVSIGQDGLYVSGCTQSSGSWITLGNNMLPAVGNRYGFLAKLDLDGTVKYTTVLGGNANDEILAMQTVSNMIYLAGTTYSTDFCNEHTLNTSGGSKDGFVLKLTDNGTTYTTNWFRYIGTNTMDTVQSLALMDSNRVVVCGSTDAGGWMPGQDEASKAYSGGTDGFIVQLNCELGAPLWSTYVGGTSHDAAYAVAIGGTSVFVGGITGSDGWEMFGGFQDQWGGTGTEHLNTETGFIGMWSQAPGMPPVITNDLAGVTVHEGERVEFFLGVNSTLDVKYYWFKNGVSVGGVSTNRYVIDPSWVSDDGTFYQCLASNVFGCATSSVAYLVIDKGILDVSLTPPLAVEQGAKWQLTGDVWRTSGAIPAYPGTYTVAFTNIPGWITPATRQVDVVASQTTTVVAVYVQAGILHVSILPSDAVAQGAAWQLEGDIWRTNEVVELYPGTYTIAFTNMHGKITPETRQVDVVSGQTTNVLAVYEDAPSATAVRTISNWTDVSLVVTCPPEVSAWTLVEQIPTNATPALYGTGVWNGIDRTLTYTGTGTLTMGYTTLLGVDGDFVISGSSITSMTNNITKPVTGNCVVSRGSFLRKISGTQVTVYMSQPTNTTSWILNEKLYGTLSLNSIPNGAETYMDESGILNVEWADRSSVGTGKILTYRVSGEDGSTNAISGTCLYSGTLHAIYGDNTVIIHPEPPLIVPHVSFSSDSVTADESKGSVELRVVGGTVTGVTSVAYWIVTGTATAGLDYTVPASMPRRIAWTNAFDEQTITIPIKTDALIEDDETFYVLLGSPTNCVINEPSVCKVTITDANSGLTLADALDNTLLTWTTGGTPAWVPQRVVTSDNEDAAASGAMASNKMSYVQTTVTGTGTVNYAWSVAGMGTLRLLDGTKVLAAVTNTTDWQIRTLRLTNNVAHMLKWEFTQGSSTNGRAYLDQVEWLPGSKMGVAVTALASNPLGGLATGTGVYYVGAKVPLNAKPRPGWLFTGWTPTNYFAKPLIAAQMLTVSNSAITVTANFAKVPVVMGLPNPPEGGTVSGSGLCLPGKSVPLKATPAAKWAFTSWSDGSMLASRVVSATGDVTLYAGFKSISQIAVPAITNPGAQNVMVGVPFRLALQVASECLPTVTVIGLPAGLTFDAGTRTISGVQSAVPAGGAVTASILASNPAGKAADAKFTITVAPLTASAQGTFTGIAIEPGADADTVKGLFTMTVTPIGAISAKVTRQESAVSFTGKSWDTLSNGMFHALLRTVKGETLAMALDTGVAWNAAGLQGTLTGGVFGASALAVRGQRNAFLVKTAPDYAPATNTLAGYKGYYTVGLHPGDVSDAGAAGNAPQGSGYLALTVKDGGAVTLAGKLADGTTLSGSATLFVQDAGVAGISAYVPLFFPLYSARGVFSGLMELGSLTGTAPSNNVAAAVEKVVQAWRYPGKAPTAVPPQTEDRFALTLGMSGGYYNALQDLRAHYSNGWFAVAQEPGVTNTYTSGSYTTKVGVVRSVLPYMQLAFNPATGAISLPLGKAPVYTKGIYDYAPVLQSSMDLPYPLPVYTAGMYVYAPTNPAAATLAVTKATGLFTGKFNLYYQYHDKVGALTLKTVSVTHVGVLTPLRLDASMPSGQGFYHVPDTWKSTGVPATSYLLNRSYGVEIRDEE